MNTPALVLASKSHARRRVLEGAGVSFTWCDAGVDEDALKANAASASMHPAGHAQALAEALAEAKARAAYETQNSDDIFIGCDQVLAQDGRLFDKPTSLADARAHLKAFSGQSHQLISALCMVQAGELVWSHTETANMHVRPLSDAFIDDYLQRDGEGILSSVGAYLLESRGAQLFEKIDGDYFTVLGLPLLPLLEELRKRGILPA